MGKFVRRVGDAGAGATVKLLNNMLSGTFTAALATVTQVAEAAKVDPEALMAVLYEGATSCHMMKGKLPKMLGRDFTPQFQLELMEKDLRYSTLLASDVDRPAPIAALVRSQFQTGRLASLGKLDTAAVLLQARGRS